MNTVIGILYIFLIISMQILHRKIHFCIFNSDEFSIDSANTPKLNGYLAWMEKIKTFYKTIRCFYRF